MKDSAKATAKQVLTDYLEQKKHRKTPERFAILDAVYSLNRRFSIKELCDELQNGNFMVSRATVYNTIKILVELRIVLCHNINKEARYEACGIDNNHLLQICSVCGNVVEINSPEVVAAVAGTRLHRFRRERFSLYIHGVCSACQARITRKKNMEQKNINKIK